MAWTVDVRLEPGPDAAAAARDAIAQLEPQLPEHRLEELRLLTSELVTNSVRHGDLDDHEAVRLRARLSDDCLRVEVSDPGAGFEPLNLPEPRSDQLGGWGLYLVSRIADRWGVLRGKCTRVWLEIDGPQGA